MNTQRFKNYGFWIALASFVILVLQQAGLGIDVGKYNEILFALLNVLVLAGIINDPNTTDSLGFADDK